MQARQISIVHMCVLLAVWLGCLPQFLSAQILEFEQNPPSIRWRQVQTTQFHLIFPEAMENKAMEMSTQLDSLMKVVNADLLRTPSARQTPLILQNQSVLSNGFVQLAPRRTELVSTPPAQGSNQDWIHQLTIHELRHIGQFDRLVGRMGAPFGEQLGLAMFGVHLPVWFYEGDAVRVESLLTPGGRGRTPSWIMPYRAQLLSGDRYSYQKDFLGSYQDLTPGVYEMGYLLVDRMYHLLGANTADSLLGSVSRNLLRPYSFSKALKGLTGRNTQQWHQETLDSLIQTWRAEELAAGSQVYPLIQPLIEGWEKFPADLLLPQWSEDEASFYVLRQGRSFVPEIIKMDTAGRVLERVVKLGWQVEPHFSYAAGRITWDERRTNPRYAKQNYHVVMVHDVATGRSRQLSQASRLFSPTLSPDAARIAAVEVGLDNRFAIVVLDSESGQQLDSFPAPEGWALQTPSFHPAGDRLVAVAISTAGSAIVQLDLRTDQYLLLSNWEFQQIERPVYADGVLFKGHYAGKDQLYRLKDGTHQLTNARFGAFHPAPGIAGNNLLLFNEYQHGGYRVALLDLSRIAPKTVRLPESVAQPDTKDTAAGPPILSKPYRGIGTVFNFHSLSISAGDYSSLDAINPGLFLLSDNLLNTVQTRLGYLYDSELRNSEYQASISYQRFFPQWTLQYANRPRSGTTMLPDQAVNLQWREHHTSLRMNIPLNWHHRNHVYGVNLTAGTSMTKRYGLAVDPSQDSAREQTVKLVENRFIRRILFPLQAGISVGHNQRSSSLDLAPRWGQHAALNFRALKNQADRGGPSSTLWSLRTVFYFPGIMHHHSLQVRLNYQRGKGTYQDVNDIPMVSGYVHLPPELVRSTALFTYRFPVAYPDWEVGNLAYITRIKGGIFSDFQNIDRHNLLKNRPRTWGIEIRADLNLLRFYLPRFDVGGRLIYVPESGQFLANYSFSYSY